MAALLFLAAFGTYVSTLAPGITWHNEGSDSGELAAAVHTLGVPHPPGYPTYMLLGKAFSTLVPLRDTAFRLNLLSALLSAATVTLVYYLALEIAPRLLQPWESPAPIQVLALAGAASLAFSPLFWSQSLIAEVYALNAFFVSLITFLLVRGARSAQKSSRYLWPLAFFLLGLGLGNHLTLIFLLPLALYWVVRHTTRPQAALYMGIPLLLGLGVYLYLPWRAASNPPVNWGDASSLKGFLWMVSAQQYRQFVFALPLEYTPGRVAAWAALLIEQFHLLGIALGLIGLAYTWRRLFPVAIYTLSLFLLFSAYAIGYNTADSDVYLLPTFLVFAMWIGLGLYMLVVQVSKMRWAGPVLGLTALALVPLVSLAMNYSRVSLRYDVEAQEYARQVFQQIEAPAVIVAEKDPQVFSLWYHNYVVEENSQVIVIAKPLLQYDWYLPSLKKSYPDLLILPQGAGYQQRLLELIDKNRGHRTVYLTYADALVLGQFPYVTEGELYRLR